MRNARLPGLKTAVLLTVVAVVCLIAYGIIMGYHHEPLLLLTVVVVRLLAGYGLASVVGALVAIVMLLRRKPRVLASFVSATLTIGALTVLGLIVLNLAEGI